MSMADVSGNTMCNPGTAHWSGKRGLIAITGSGSPDQVPKNAANQTASVGHSRDLRRLGRRNTFAFSGGICDRQSVCFFLVCRLLGQTQGAQSVDLGHALLPQLLGVLRCRLRQDSPLEILLSIVLGAVRRLHMIVHVIPSR